MHAIWRGAVSFGLVYVPVKLYTATESHDVSFRQVHTQDGGRIRYRKVCSVDGEEVPSTEISKGYELENGEMVVLSDADFASLPTTSSREISVEQFVPTDQIDPLLFEKSYYLEPDATGVKAYALLMAALKESDRMAVVTVALRQRTSMALLRVRPTDNGDVIVLQTMMWPDEVRTPQFNIEAEDVKPSEVAMAQMLVDTLAGDFDPSGFDDAYSDAIHALVKAKVEGGEIAAVEAGGRGGADVIDLMAALQKSVDEAKRTQGAEGNAAASDGDQPDEKAVPVGASTKKTSSGPKTAAPKASAKKRASKKAAPKKSA